MCTWIDVVNVKLLPLGDVGILHIWTGEIYADEFYSSASRGIIPKLIIDTWQSASRAWYQLQPICLESAKYFSTLVLLNLSLLLLENAAVSFHSRLQFRTWNSEKQLKRMKLVRL